MALTQATYAMIDGAPANVLDYGADPTGAADSSAAFTAACAVGRSVFVPKGTYKASFQLRNNQILFGEGARGRSILVPPAGAAYVVSIDPNAYSETSKQHCQIRDLSIENLASVANCVGVFFAATDVTEINDNHRLTNVYIKGFKRGVHITGRFILGYMENVEIDTCENALLVQADPTNYAFNLNTFVSCRFISCTAEGVRITGYNTVNTFISCNIESNNTADVVGVAGMYVEDAEGLNLISPYFETNGRDVVVDPVNPLNNSIGLYLAGVRCFNLRVLNGWMVQSGTMIAVNVSSGIIGGEISGVRFAPNATGFDIYVGDKIGGPSVQPLIVDANNYFSGAMSFKTDGAGRTAAVVRQASSTVYVTSDIPLDLRHVGKITANNAAPFSLTQLTNLIPGLEFWVRNVGAGTLTIDGSFIQGGVASTVATNTSKLYMVLGFPGVGKLVEV